ncbi:TonB-dependent receptor [Acidomonas methanolica]|nr:TonB-dependent receptor plug domain-containing protein [Acidomonas methanolica]MBU2655283.1 TonB-dependent receptor plug domain-containing protein [Acidomonas methanolica]
MSRRSAGLLSQLAFLFSCSTVLAATPDPAGSRVARRHDHPRPPASAHATPAAAPKPARDENIQVVGAASSATGVTNTTPGGGLLAPETAAQAQQTVTRDFIAKQSPTSNPLALIQYVPGVTLSSADAFGQSDQSSFYMRGMGQTSVGYTLNGIPAADPSHYVPFTSQAADTENISHITVQQGVADIAMPVYNALAGSIKESLTDPAEHFGGKIDLSYGNHQAAREFIRLDSGRIGQSGIKTFASYSYGTHAMWLGPGRSRRSHVDAMALREWGEGNSARVFMTYNQSSEPYLMSITKQQWAQSGRSAAYYDPTYSTGDYNYYKLNETHQHSVIIGAPLSFNLGHGLTFESSPYYVHIHGAGDNGQTQAEYGYNGTQPTGNLNIPNAVDGYAPVLAIDNWNQHSAGFNNSLSWKLGHNELKVGYWYNYYDQHEIAPLSQIGPNGEGENYWGKYPIRGQNGVPLMLFNIHLIQQLNSVFLSDTYKALNDRLTLNAGFKFVMMSYHSTNAIPGDQYNYGRNDAQPLPQVSASFQITPHDQIYLDGATAFMEPTGILVYGTYWDGSAPIVDQAHSTNLKAEYSISEEIGYRHSGLVNITASFFNYNMTNKQSAISTYVGGRLLSNYVNAGGQTSRGFQFAAGLRPWHGFSPYVSFQYLHVTTDNNLPSGLDYIRSAGKIAPYSPKTTVNVGLSYDNGNFFVNGYMSYVGSQYATYMDDQTMPAYAIGNVTAGYRFKKLWIAKSPQVQVNVMNLTDNKYLSAGNGGYNAKTTTGVFGSTIPGRAPTYIVGGGFGIIFSVTTGF